ncbi:MAG: tRNA glutamyl-Q(34) synthetase GluQRS [Acidobacteria bacterium]|nr:tRNA glutamyl-Q(34) synthetase GluQRS [Acidobacteriota bacterium]
MIVSRFAPSPTGFLHLGHVLNAIHVWGLTRAAGGRVLLRIEDHDRLRSRTAYEHAIFDDLDWLGFAWDDEPVRQSERTAVYARALERLRAEGLVYACDCSRAAIVRRGAGAGASARGGAADPELRYPGTCADRRIAERPDAGLRVRLSPDIIRFTDLRHGAQAQQPAEQCGDLLARDRDGNWTYQFGVAVDDLAQGVTLVVRGDDLLASTGRQIQIARLLGRAEPPRFLHHALIMTRGGRKLSKSDGDTGVRDLRAAGMSANEVIGRAAFLGGLIPAARPVAAAEASSIIGA